MAYGACQSDSDAYGIIGKIQDCNTVKTFIEFDLIYFRK